MLEMRKKRGAKPKVTKAMAEQMRDYSLKGYSMVSIGKHFNVDDSTVCRAIKKLKDGKY